MKPKASYCIFILLLFFGSLHAQKNSNIAYTQIIEKYDDLKENNIQAFPFVNNLIGKAKREKNYRWMVTGYIDGLFYSPVITNKLKYADSAIWAAHLSQNATLISNSYLAKGSVYYFNLKKYQLALNEYLKAYEYSKKDIDEYEKNKIIYHLGVVKSYIGYYHEALVHFKKTSLFFESELKNKKLHPNEVYNNERGYYNSLHQMIICNRHLKRYKTVDSLLYIGINGTFGNNDYEYERSYFYKETGIKEFREKEYSKAIVSLKRSLPHLIQYNDFAWVGISYFYIGKSYLKSNNTHKGIQYLQKVDSIFQKNSFILPELRENYELLINHYKGEGNVERELYFTKQLLKADDFLSKDFTYLSSKIHKEYDTNTLLEEKLKLEKSSFQNRLALISLGVFVLILIVLLVLKYRKEKESQIKYKILEQKILDKEKEQIIDSTSKTREGYKSELDKNIVNDIFIKLKHFEDHCEFTESGLTLNKLAARFDTNSSYLSQIINEYKGTNFNRYLGELRIHYITNKLYNDRKYLNYKIETLAEECGIASRTNFSNLFQEINGIRPADFIKKRWENINK